MIASRCSKARVLSSVVMAGSDGVWLRRQRRAVQRYLVVQRLERANCSQIGDAGRVAMVMSVVCLEIFVARMDRSPVA